MLRKNLDNSFKTLNESVVSIFILLFLTITAIGQPTPPTLVSNRCSDYAAPSVPAPLPGRTFYIDAQNGNDSNSGTSAASWRTLAKANANAQAGTLFLLRGVFTDQWINPSTSGTAANKIIYRKEPGQTAILEEQSGDGVYGVVIGENRSHIVIDGLEIRNTPSPFQVVNGGSYVWLRNLYIHDSGGSTFRFGANNNRLEDSVLIDIGSDQANDDDSVTILGDADNNIVVRNYFGNAGHGAYDIIPDLSGNSDNNIFAQNIVDNQWSTGIFLNGRAVNTLVECNIFRNSSQNTIFNYPRPGIQVTGDNNIIRYNYIYNNKSDGIVLQGYIFATVHLQYPENNQIYHNTIVGNGRSGLYIFAGDSGYPNASAFVRNNNIENNLLWNNGGGNFPDDLPYDIVANFYFANNPWSPGFTDGNIFRYNNASNRPFLAVYRHPSRGGNYVYDTPALAQTANPSWTNNRRDNPLFTNPSANDYSLLSNSPMIDQGRLIPGVIYNGSAPDLGAFESGSTQPQTPYPGPNAPTIPTTLEVENFDNGGQGVAYNDNFGATGSGVYRSIPTETVDVQVRSTASNGYAVFEVSAGEWLEYTINASSAGIYNINVGYASEFNNGKFHVEIDGIDVTGQMTANSTGGWGTFQTVSKTGVSISAGQHIVRLALDTNSPDSCGCVVANFDSITFQASTNSVTWQNIQGTTSTGGTVQHSGTHYFGMAKSQQTLSTSGYFEWTYNGYGGETWVGLGNNDDEQPNTAQFDLSYSSSGSIREFGVWKEDTNAVPGDRLRIEITSNGTVIFKKNGQTIYTSQTPASGLYYLVFKSQEVAGYGINNAIIGSN